MERGEDWEYEAVQDQWATIERQQRVAKRLLAAFFLGLVASILLLLAATPEACISGRGASNTCNSVTTGAAFDVLMITGIGALSGGLWFCRSALNIQSQYGRNGC